MKIKTILQIASTLLVLLSSGCTNLGPSRLQASRNDYNIAIQQTGDEQLLLNLVRLKYRDRPLFLEVSSVSSQFTFQTGFSASGSFPVGSDTYGLGGLATFAEKPTITFTPLQGEKFVQRLLAPIGLDTILLLAHSGWRIDRVLRLCVQRLNGVKNAPSASGPTPSQEPVYKEFVRASKLLRVLQFQDDLHVGYEADENKKSPVLYLSPSASNSETVGDLLQILKLNPGLNRYRITADITAGNSGTLAIGTRSLLGVMFYLSQAVEVPDVHKEAGKVTLTKTASGGEF